MPTYTSTLGRCPNCETPIPASNLLIEFETTDGRGRYAECPGCRDVITPR